MLDTKIEKERRIIGLYYENRFIQFLKSRGYNHISKHPDKYNCYDFYSELNGKNNNYYEQKSKLGLIENHKVSYIDVNKISQYRQIIKEHHNNNYEDAIFYYINCFINPNDFTDYSFYYYKVDIKKVMDYDITTLGDSNTFIIPIEDFRPIDELFKKLNKKETLIIEKQYNNNYQNALKYDKFYTKPDIVDKLIKKTNEYKSFNEYDYILEPSAGNGAISEVLTYNFNKKQNIISLDLMPENSNILEYNFLKNNIKEDFKHIVNSNNLVIGNPPFSKKESMGFIKKASEIANTISFILPISHKKQSYIDRLPNNFHIVYNEILPKNSFTIDKYDYDIKSMIMILEKRDYERLKQSKKISKYFTFISCKKLKDFNNILCIRRVGSNTGKISLYNDNIKTKSHYFIRLNDNLVINRFLEGYSQIDFKKIDYYNVAQKSLSMNDIIDITNKIII